MKAMNHSCINNYHKKVVQLEMMKFRIFVRFKNYRKHMKKENQCNLILEDKNFVESYS
jgi:hypothetical protein